MSSRLWSALALVALARPAVGSDPDLELRVKVALELARAGKPLAQAVADCGGRCSTDLEACRAEALRTGRPIVLFVAAKSCEGRAAGLPATALPCRVGEYDRDGQVANVPRIVILARGTGRVGSGVEPERLYLRAELPADASAATIADTLKTLDTLEPSNPTKNPAATAASEDWMLQAPSGADVCRT